VTICTVIEEEYTGNGALTSLPASLAAHDEDSNGGGGDGDGGGQRAGGRRS
jgi:hypothetical protein